jgi:D-amino-acid dehydrogenase
VAELIVRTGMLYVYPSYADFMQEAVAWAIRRENGVTWLELGPEELRRREPMLDRRYGFGVFVEGSGQCRDPGGYVAALVRHAEARGATVRRAGAEGFQIEGGRLRAVRAGGETIGCDRAVIAAGARSKHLARAAGDAVPLENERGYHTMIAASEAGPRHLTMPSDGKMVNSAMVAGLRVAGQVEFAGLAARPNWRRAAILRDHLLRSYPDLPRELPAGRVTQWMGHRPSLPDSLPCIGPASGCADVVHAYGHGHIGLASGPVTGQLVADLVDGRPPVIDPAPYRPDRFRA